MTRSSNVIATAWRRKNLNERYTIRFSNMKSPEEWKSPERKKAT